MSSTSNIHLDDSTVSKPNLKAMLKCLAFGSSSFSPQTISAFLKKLEKTKPKLLRLVSPSICHQMQRQVDDRFTDGLEVKFRAFLKEYPFLERVLIERTDMKNSLDSKLKIDSICSIGIRSRTRDIIEKLSTPSCNDRIVAFQMQLPHMRRHFLVRFTVHIWYFRIWFVLSKGIHKKLKIYKVHFF